MVETSGELAVAARKSLKLWAETSGSEVTLSLEPPEFLLLPVRDGVLGVVGFEGDRHVEGVVSGAGAAVADACLEACASLLGRGVGAGADGVDGAVSCSVGDDGVGLGEDTALSLAAGTGSDVVERILRSEKRGFSVVVAVAVTVACFSVSL